MDNHISVPRVHILTPVPGTPLYDEMEAEGRIISRDFDRFSGGQVVATAQICCSSWTTPGKFEEADSTALFRSD